jgi:RNA polymerase sigma-70 factor, ECF subfamily
LAALRIEGVKEPRVSDSPPHTTAPLEPAEAELVASLRAGQPGAYVALMRGNNQRLYRLARGILRNEAEAEEVVQETYTRAFTHLEGFKGEASLATWLARIVTNEALGRLRCRRPMVDIDDVAETLGAGGEGTLEPRPSPTPEQAIARQEIRRAIERGIDALPAIFRGVFVMRIIEQMSTEETAACLGIPQETVKSRLHRANRLLREPLTAEFGAILDDTFPFMGARCDRLVAAVLKRLGLPPDTIAAAPERDRPAPPRS